MNINSFLTKVLPYCIRTLFTLPQGGSSCSLIELFHVMEWQISFVWWFELKEEPVSSDAMLNYKINTRYLLIWFKVDRIKEKNTELARADSVCWNEKPYQLLDVKIHCKYMYIKWIIFRNAQTTKLPLGIFIVLISNINRNVNLWSLLYS